MRALRLLATIATTALLVTVSPVDASAETLHKTLDGWDVYVEQTPSDGMRAYSAIFSGTVMLTNGIKMPNTRADYPDGTSILDQFYGDLTGDAGSGDAKIDFQNTSGGFKFRRLYTFGTQYTYLLVYFFRNNGRIDITLEARGPGAPFHGGSPRYFAFWRMDYDIDSADGDSIGVWDGQWSQVQTEAFLLDDGQHNGNGEEWRFRDGALNNPLAPASDTARFWALRYVSGEGNSDLAGAADPGSYLSGQNIEDTDVVGWYRGIPRKAYRAQAIIPAS